MSVKNKLNPLAVALGTTFAISLTASPIINAADNPFAANQLTNGGYQVAEGSCGDKKGEGSCGDTIRKVKVLVAIRKVKVLVAIRKVKVLVAIRKKKVNVAKVNVAKVNVAVINNCYEIVLNV